MAESGNETHFHRAIRKHGFEDFESKVLEKFDEKEKSWEEREIYWIDYYDTFYNGYNMTTGGGGVTLFGEENGMYGSERFGELNPFYGKKHTQKSKDMISDSLTGVPLSQSHKDAVSKAGLEREKIYRKCVHCGRECNVCNIKQHEKACQKNPKKIKWIHKTKVCDICGMEVVVTNFERHQNGKNCIPN